MSDDSFRTKSGSVGAGGRATLQQAEGRGNALDDGGGASQAVGRWYRAACSSRYSQVLTSQRVAVDKGFSGFSRRPGHARVHRR